MPPPLRLALLLALPACLDSANTLGTAGLDPNAINVLFVGNSLTATNNLPGMVEALIDSTGPTPADARAVAFANFGLEDHWLDGEALRSIERGGWDYVVLQQGPSATEGRPSLLEYSKRFGDVIRASGAQPALYMVWPSQVRSFDWDGVRDSYAMAADSAEGLFLPAGDAWRVAWERDSTLEFYSNDGFHPNIRGTYVAALVIVQRLTGRTPVGMPTRFSLEDGPVVAIDPDIALAMQEAAREANERSEQ